MIANIQQAVTDNVRRALSEDIGSGDISASLIPVDIIATANVITREAAIICGQPWVDEVFRQLDPSVEVIWYVQDGERVDAGERLFKLSGPARSLLTGERTALNFLQFLSGIATRCRHYVDLVAHTEVKILDTRKTIPGLRLAQKYAITMGGGHNHRIGLYDAYLIKENHIAACGSMAKAIIAARRQDSGKLVELEVETLAELKEAQELDVDMIMLDNFDLEMMYEAVSISSKKLEVSGGVTESNLKAIAETGVDYISIGTLTKDCKAIDLSMRFE